MPAKSSVGTSGMTVTLIRSLDEVRAALRCAGVSEWRVEAEVLLRCVLGVGRSEFLAQVYGEDDQINPSQAARLEALLLRRLSGEPLSYIVGVREFYGLDLEINEHVLIPRQETELLVDIALEYLQGFGPKPTVVDVGTGSGAVALAIAAHGPQAAVVGTDISRQALDVARRNAVKLGLETRVRFISGDLLEPIQGRANLIVSNPPYIPSGQIGDLQREVRREPAAALDGGVDGLQLFRRLLVQVKDRLKRGGVMVVELMPEQMETAIELVARAMPGIAAADVRNDLAGNPRALVIET